MKCKENAPFDIGPSYRHSEADDNNEASGTDQHTHVENKRGMIYDKMRLYNRYKRESYPEIVQLCAWKISLTTALPTAAFGKPHT